MKIIFDFIKSWLYYPTLKKWLFDRNYTGFKDGRFQYAIKHCMMIRETGKSNKNNNLVDWKCEYKQEPIEK